ncbi:MAG: crosslink repair DNA glycosylase YcaQ family protein, partial [Devosia sp.]
MTAKPISLPPVRARRLWLHAQRLDSRDPFGAGPAATAAAVAHLGYVQIDTINVIERAHHHILFSRIPGYRGADLGAAQSADKSVFEYWAHALAYIPTADIAHYTAQMRAYRREPMKWYAGVGTIDVNRVVRLIHDGGPLSIRDVEDDVLVEKDHPWASRKPSKAALQRAFFEGRLAISGREGMLKTYELMERHFGWTTLPKSATANQTAAYLLDRALRSQGLVNGASVMHPKLRFSPEIAAIVERRVRRKELLPLEVDGEIFYAEPAALDADAPEPGLTH